MIVFQDIEAIAVTVKPGLALSLQIGLEYAKELVQQSGYLRFSGMHPLKLTTLVVTGIDWHR
jgi:tRNA A37 threonylcarbamoyltransferase TsaD